MTKRTNIKRKEREREKERERKRFMYVHFWSNWSEIGFCLSVIVNR